MFHHFLLGMHAEGGTIYAGGLAGITARTEPCDGNKNARITFGLKERKGGSHLTKKQYRRYSENRNYR